MIHILLKKLLFFSLLIVPYNTHTASNDAQITPCKFDDPTNIRPYIIPASSQFTTPRQQPDAPEIVYYVSTPQTSSYPICIMCGGSSNEESLKQGASIIYVHRYFLQELLDAGCAVLTLEQWGVDGNTDTADVDIFMEHYTRSQRLADHQTIIDHLIQNCPAKWNGQFVFFWCFRRGPSGNHINSTVWR